MLMFCLNDWGPGPPAPPLGYFTDRHFPSPSQNLLLPADLLLPLAAQPSTADSATGSAL